MDNQNEAAAVEDEQEPDVIDIMALFFDGMNAAEARDTLADLNAVVACQLPDPIEFLDGVDRRSREVTRECLAAKICH